MNAEQITKADRNACHALRRRGKARATLRRLSSTVLQSVAGEGNSFEVNYLEVGYRNLHIVYELSFV